MPRPVSAAKDLLARHIVAQARLEGAPLSELEQKMLYLSQSNEANPEFAEAVAEFDRGCARSGYEQKVGQLAEARYRTLDDTAQQAWDRAVDTLADDLDSHYLLELLPETAAVLPAPEIAWGTIWRIVLWVVVGFVALYFAIPLLAPYL